MIELRDVTITAGQLILSGVSFQVAAGDYAVLMGRTGQGKTSILEAICGLRSIQQGSILIANRNVTQSSPAARGIGYVPQDLALFPTMTVRDHLLFALRLRRSPQKLMADRVSELADVLGIGSLLNRHPQGLSGGEAQRVALGRALSFRPSVLLLDEPFSALDEATRAGMHHLLKTITQKWQMTTLHVTHSTEEAEVLATRRLLLLDGKIQQT
ncbi:MAG: ABC transporter ATP-binding protein [Planctomycetaceae bacterium]